MIRPGSFGLGKFKELNYLWTKNQFLPGYKPVATVIAIFYVNFFENFFFISLISLPDADMAQAYYGIHIPTEFVRKYEAEVYEGSMKPLLFEWIKENSLVKLREE